MGNTLVCGSAQSCLSVSICKSCSTSMRMDTHIRQFDERNGVERWAFHERTVHKPPCGHKDIQSLTFKSSFPSLPSVGRTGFEKVASLFWFLLLFFFCFFFFCCCCCYCCCCCCVCVVVVCCLFIKKKKRKNKTNSRPFLILIEGQNHTQV